MNLVEVEITGQVITAQYGTLNTGDILRTNAAFAKHLVEDCCGAKYREASPASTDEASAVTRITRKKRTVAEAVVQPPMLDKEPPADLPSITDPVQPPSDEKA